MPDSRQKLYNALSNQFDLGSFDEFNSKMNNPESRKKLYNYVSSSFDLGSFDEFETKIAGTPKKKVPTQVSKPSVGSSGTTETPQKQSSDSSKPDGIYKYQGNLKANYKKENGQWYIDPTGGTKFQPLKQGDVAKRVKILESQAKREFNPYLEPEEKLEFKPETKQAKPTEKIVGVEKKAQDVFKKEFQALDENDPIVIQRNTQDKKTNELIAKATTAMNLGETEGIVELKKIFNQPGYNLFDFEETGAGDAVRIINKKTGESKVFTFDTDDKTEMDKLTAFVNMNVKYKAIGDLTEESKKLQEEIDATYDPNKKLELSRKLKEVNNKLKIEESVRLSDATTDKNKAWSIYDKDAQQNAKAKIDSQLIKAIDYREKKKDLDKRQADLDAALRNNKLSYEDYKTKYLPSILAEKEQLSVEEKEIKSTNSELEYESQRLNEVAGYNMLAQAERGDFLSGISASFLKGVESPFRLIAGAAGVKTEKGFMMDEVLAGLATDEYISDEKRSDIEKALFSISESLGAAAGGAAITGGVGGVMSGPGATLGTYALSYYSLKDEIDSDPDMANVSEGEKMLLSGVYGGVIGLLDKFGLSKSLSKNPIGKKVVNGIMSKVFTSLPKDATAEMIEAAVNSEVKSVIAKGIVNTAGGFVNEGATEGLQEFADVTIRDLYNKAKGKELLDKPKTWGEIFERAGESFWLGGLGGAAMSGATQAVEVPKQLRTVGQLKSIERIIDNPDMMDIFTDDLKVKVLNGEMSVAKAKGAINEMRESQAVFNMIPADVENKYTAFKLISEREALSREIEGKDPALVEDKKQRVSQIEEELRTLPKKQENAVQERSTEEVLPREQEQAGETGGQREGMGQSLEGQEATQEEDPLSNVESTARALNSDLVKQIQDESGELFPLTTEEDLDYFTNLSERYHKAKQNGTNPELVNAFEKVLGFEQTNIDNTQKVEDLRAQEQAELIEAIPNAEQYMTDGKVDEAKITDPDELKTFNEIYDKYDEEITPLIRESKVEESPVVEEVTKELETKKPIENVELKLNVDSTTDGLQTFLSEDNEVIAKEETEIVTILPDDKNPSFKIDKGILRIRIPSLDVAGRSGGGTYVNLKVPDGFDSEVFAKKLATIRHDKNRTDIEGKATAKVVNEVRQAIQDSLFESVVTEQSTIDDVKTLDTTDATNLQRVLGFIESIENDLDNFGKGTLGMNLPVAVAKAVIKSIKVLLQAGVTLEQAIKQAAIDNNVTEQDIMDTMVAVQASQATQNRVRAKVTGQKAPKVSPAAKAAKAITKKPAPKMVTVDEMAALKDQIRLEARAARGAKANIKENIEKISTLIKSMVTAKGDIKQRHLKYIFNKLASTNLTSDESVDKLLDYIFKKMTDANYLNKLDEIEKINKAIKNNKNMVAEIKYLADMFTKIDLSKVSNIDKHLEIANKLKESLARYTKKTDPTGVEFRKNVDYQELYDYVSKNEGNLKTKIEKSLSDVYDKLFGEGTSDGMSEEDMINKINEAKADKVAEMRDIVEAKLEELKNTIDEDTPDVIKRAVSLDPKLVPISDLIDIINGITMYMDNGIVSGMKKIVAKYEGVEAANKSKVRFKKLIGLLGRKVTEMYNDYYNYADSILTKKTAKKGDVEQVKKESGAIDIERGYNKSRIQRNEEESKYKKKFGKIKNFNRSNNIVERRVIAHMQRERMDNEKQKTYFNDRKNLLKNSVDNLKNANNSLLVEQGKLLEAAAIKLGVLNKDGSVNESTTINDINSKTEKFNVDAVKYIQEMFSEIYDALYDHSLGFYNILLERDANYTPDVIKSAKPKKPGDEESATMSDFARFTGMLIKKAGVLMTTNRPKSLAKDQYISLDFDQDMFEAYESALRDLYTSEHKQKFNAYRKSDAFRDIMGKDKDGISKDAEFINSVYDYYITEKDGNIKPDTETDKAIKKFMNKLGLYNTVMALGSFKNIFAQSIPVWMDAIVSTKAYLNPARAHKIITDSFDPRMWDFVARCDSQVALRGEDAIRFTERVRNTIKKETVAGGVKNFAGKINYIPEMILKITNQYPDKVAAIGTWMGYYREYLDQNKLPFDYETPNADAINYAETRTKIQILPGDSSERGRIGKSTVTNTIFRLVFSPFSSVNMNAKNRIYGDVLRIFRGDRLNAMNDLIGATVGITSFHLINTYWKIYVGGLLGSLLFGDDDDEETAAKKEESYIKNALTQGTQDYLSPMPMMDALIPFIGNKIISAYELGLPEEQKWNEFLENKVASLKKKENKRYTDEEIEKMRIKFFKDNQFQLRDQALIEYADKYGSLAISYKQSKELFDIFQSATTGVYISEFNGKPVEKILPEAGKEKMQDVLYAKIAGLLSTDINRQAQQAYYKVGKEMSLTANQAETADEIKEWADRTGYKMDEYTYQAIKNESSLNKIKAAIRKMDSMSVKEKEEYIKSLKD